MSYDLEVEADYKLVTSSVASGAAEMLSVGRWRGFPTSMQDQERLRAASRRPPGAEEDWTRVALRMVMDLGPEFSSENPHDLAERGNGWFGEP